MLPSGKILGGASGEETPHPLPWWVGVIGICSLLFGIILIPLLGFAIPRFEPPRSSSDSLYWMLLGGFWLSPFVFAYSFVLTTLRSTPADWRRGRSWFISVVVYLAVAGALGASI